MSATDRAREVMNRAFAEHAAGNPGALQRVIDIRQEGFPAALDFADAVEAILTEPPPCNAYGRLHRIEQVHATFISTLARPRPQCGPIGLTR